MFSVQAKIHARRSDMVLKGDTIYVTVRGAQKSEQSVQLIKNLGKMIGRYREQNPNKRPLLYIDARDSSSTTVGMPPELRQAVKDSFALEYAATAVIGNSHLLEMLLHMSHISGSQVRYFTSETKAKRWLASHSLPAEKQSNVVLIAAGLIAVIGTVGLLGWAIDSRTLTSIVSALRPINPMGTLGLLTLAIALAADWREYRRTALFASGLIILLGVLALLPIDIDHLLFAQKVRDAGAHTSLADSAGIAFILSGLGLLIHRSSSFIARVANAACFSSILILSLINFYGLLYAADTLYSLGASSVMALSLSVGFAVFAVARIAVALRRFHPGTHLNITPISWLIIIVILFGQIGTYLAWREAIVKNEADARRAFTLRTGEIDKRIQNRVTAYIDALYGFRGLFAASDAVSEGEFNTYYNSIDLTYKYPGLRTLSYIRRVESKDLDAYVKQVRTDTSALPGGRPAFVVQQQTTDTVHYLLTYLSNNTPSTALGTDFSSVPIRKATYEAAFASGKPTASDTLLFGGTDTTPTSRGFFITEPVSNKSDGDTAGDAKYAGLVSAVFYYDDFFSALFDNENNLLEDVDIAITNGNGDGSNVFARDDVKKQTSLSHQQSIPVANREWQLHVQAAKTFGTTESQDKIPSIILFSGQAFSILLLVIFLTQSQARRRALELADAITADLQAERNTAVSVQQKDDAILSSIGDAVLAVDSAGRITLFNPAAQQISGYSEAEALNKPYSEVLDFQIEATGAPNYSFITTALKGQRTSMQNHTVLIHKNGTHVPVADSAAPIHDLNNKLTGAIIVFRDISTEYQLDKAKTEFVSLASHQLRTPLSAINWYSEMLLNGDAGTVTPDQKSYLQEIYEGNQRMIDLVNSLLDVSRLDLGKLINEPAANNIAEVIESLDKEMQIGIQAKHMVIAKNIEPNLPSLVTDPKLIRMIVQNLFSNAVKYTPDKGTVTITARTATEQDIATAQLKAGTPSLFLSVRDTGYGIPKIQQDKIFTKLFRADNVRALDVEGTGLGLYIVKEVIQKLGGEVWFESTESLGSTFYVILPFGKLT